MKEQLVQTFKR